MQMFAALRRTSSAIFGGRTTGINSIIGDAFALTYAILGNRWGNAGVTLSETQKCPAWDP